MGSKKIDPCLSRIEKKKFKKLFKIREYFTVIKNL
jgi:hypothetical protein